MDILWKNVSWRHSSFMEEVCMIIDFHTHIFPDKIAARSIEQLESASGITASTNGTLQGLLDSMDKNGVDISVIMPVVTKPSQFETVNTFAAKVNETYKGKLISFGGIHPDSYDYRTELDRIKELGIQGIKLHPDYQGVMIDDKRYIDIIRYADELGLIILVHAGIDIGLPNPVHCPPKKIKKVIEEIKPGKLILAHMGGWKQWEEVYEFLAGEDVYMDTSFTFDYIEEEMFLKLLAKHGCDKVLFATDSPWSNSKKTADVIRKLPIADEQKKSILFRNAGQLLKL